MNILHILKSLPDATTRKIIELQSSENRVATIDLTKGGVDYDQLVADIFANDQVVCW